jgi:hypothetical protein
MSFYVTPSFTVIDTEGSFSRLPVEEKLDLLYNARDIWENNNGQWKGSSPLPKVVKGRIDPEATYGMVTP